MLKDYRVVYKGLTIIERIRSVGRNESDCQDRLFQYIDEIYFDSKLHDADKECVELYELN